MVTQEQEKAQAEETQEAPAAVGTPVAEPATPTGAQEAPQETAEDWRKRAQEAAVARARAEQNLRAAQGQLKKLQEQADRLKGIEDRLDRLPETLQKVAAGDTDALAQEIEKAKQDRAQQKAVQARADVGQRYNQRLMKILADKGYDTSTFGTGTLPPELKEVETAWSQGLKKAGESWGEEYVLYLDDAIVVAQALPSRQSVLPQKEDTQEPGMPSSRPAAGRGGPKSLSQASALYNQGKLTDEEFAKAMRTLT